MKVTGQWRGKENIPYNCIIFIEEMMSQMKGFVVYEVVIIRKSDLEQVVLYTDNVDLTNLRKKFERIGDEYINKKA